MCSCAVGFAAKPEKPGKGAKHANSADTDKDGKISLAEFTAFKKAQSKSLTDEKIKSIFEKKDTNHDGFLSSSEMKETLPIILDWPSDDSREMAGLRFLKQVRNGGEK